MHRIEATKRKTIRTEAEDRFLRDATIIIFSLTEIKTRRSASVAGDVSTLVG